ncbi:acyltransferase [Calidifontibacillus oryziterrae]|uniref:acyltransferase n=1 Tax=Calidifontibacillus oryziterrae TaxID=1191699 RepID=UPI0002EBB621|nr:acyltransferase [Calidifontibacillus oryziterrae]
MTTVTKERITYLDIFRAIAILAVIVIHTIAQPVTLLPTDSAIYPAYISIYALVQFAVPSFIFLSGFVLFYSYESRWNLATCKAFFKKRILFIVIPYVLWSLFYFLVLQLGYNQNPFTHIPNFLRDLLVGKNYTHLYFIFIIIQFYILFPGFMYILKRFTFIRKYLIWIVISIQLIYYLLNLSVFKIQATGSFFMTYLLFFLLGAYIGLHYKDVIEKIRTHSKVYLFLNTVVAILVVIKYYLRYTIPGYGQAWMPYANFVLYYSFVPLTCISILIISRWLHDHFQATRLVRTLTSWGQGSFLIYFAHPFILLVWRHFFLSNDPIGYHITIIVGGILSLLLSWIGYIIIKRFSWSWIFMGK